MNESGKKYRVMFSNGDSLVFEYGKLSIVGDIKGLLSNIDESNPVVVFDKINAIIPEPEGESTIVNSPTPSTIRAQEEKRRQDIVGNPKAVLNDITKAQDE